MLLLAHAGFTVGGGMMVERMRRLPPLNYAALAMMSVLPDIIDRGLYLFVLPEAQSGRLIAHTLVFQLLLFAILVAIRRSFWVYGLASMLHLVLDSANLAPAQAFWPFLGSSLDHISIVEGSAVRGQSFVEGIRYRLEHEARPYTHPSARDLRLEAGGMLLLAALMARAALRWRWRRPNWRTR